MLGQKCGFVSYAMTKGLFGCNVVQSKPQPHDLSGGLNLIDSWPLDTTKLPVVSAILLKIDPETSAVKCLRYH